MTSHTEKVPTVTEPRGCSRHFPPRARAMSRARGAKSRATSRATPARLTARVLLLLACAFARFKACAGTTSEEEHSFTINTYAPNDDTSCAVGPYGWYCVPSSIQYSTSIYDPDQVWEGTTYDAATSGASTQEQACLSLCADNETLSTDLEACAEAQFELKRAALKVDSDDAQAIVYEFFVNPYNGSDEWSGGRETPWLTVERAQRRVRFLRVIAEASGLGTKLPRPLQIWVRENVGDDGMKQKQVGNGRYAGISISE
jgi:hypothetical protein